MARAPTINQNDTNIRSNTTERNTKINNIKKQQDTFTLIQLQDEVNRVKNELEQTIKQIQEEENKLIKPEIIEHNFEEFMKEILPKSYKQYGITDKMKKLKQANKKIKKNQSKPEKSPRVKNIIPQQREKTLKELLEKEIIRKIRESQKTDDQKQQDLQQEQIKNSIQKLKNKVTAYDHKMIKTALDTISWVKNDRAEKELATILQEKKRSIITQALVELLTNKLATKELIQQWFSKEELPSIVESIIS